MSAARAFVLGGSYIACSSAMIIMNKMLMQKDHFPFASCLVMLHMCGSFVLASFLLATAPSCFPSAPAIFELGLGPQPFLPFVPIGLCGAVAFVTSNMAYAYASVSFLQIMKEAHVVVIYGLSVLVGLDVLRVRSVVVLTMIACSASVAIYGELHFVWMGFWLQLVSGMTECVRIVSTNVMMSRAGAKVDPLTMVLCTAPPTILALAPVVLMTWDPRIPARAFLVWPQLSISVFLAFLLQVSIAIAIRGLSGTGLALSSVMKDLFIVASSCALLHEHLAAVQVAGFLGAVVCIGVYLAMKQFPEWFEGTDPDVPLRERIPARAWTKNTAPPFPPLGSEDTASARSSEGSPEPSEPSSCGLGEAGGRTAA